MDRRRKHGGFGVALLGAAALLAGIVGIGPVTGDKAPQTRLASADEVRRETLATWNMQGGSDSRDSKWTVGVANLARANSIVALQEAGPGMPDRITRLPDQHIGNFTVQVGRWNLDTEGGRGGYGERYVYFLPIDTNGHRVNLAMVTAQQAQEVVIVDPITADLEDDQHEPPANEHGDVTDPTQEGNLTNATATNRPMLGLRFGNTIYYDIHARAATRGRDAPAMIGNAAQQAHGGGHDWVVLGDFNRSPASLRRDIPRTYQSTTTGPTPIGRTVDGGGQGTHFSGNNLDYMVTNLDLGTDQYRGRVEDSRGGDHFPVTFRSLFGSVNDPYRLFHGNSSIDVDQNHTPGIGQVADPEDYYSIASTVGGGSEMLVDKRDGECFTDSDDDKVTEAPCDQDDPAQAFSVEKAPSSGPDDFWFRNRLANKCLSAAPITQQTPPYRGMYLGPCDRDAVLTYKRSDDDGQAHPPVFKRDAPPESDPKVPDSQGNQPPVQSQPENSDPPPAP